LLKPSYRSMLPVLNLSGHRTCLSDPTRVLNPFFPTGATSSARDCRGGDDVLSMRRLWSSITLQRSSRSRPYSHTTWFWVMRRHTSCSHERRFRLADDAASLQTRLARSLSPTEGSLQGTLTEFSATTRFDTSTPYWAKTVWGEPSGTMRWMVSIITWTRTILESRFKFWTKCHSVLRGLNGSDLLMVGYLREVFDRSPFRATMKIRRPSSMGSP
jgi:hypothetical protein